MANFTTQDIKDLREKTGAGMLDVKKALVEADGDIAKAEEIIKIKGLKGLTKREGRSTTEGLIASEVISKGDNEVGYVIELNSETDFVAKNQKFIDLSEKVLKAVVEADCADVDSALAAKTDDGTVKDTIDAAAAVFGEKIVLRRVAKIEGKHVTRYMHRTAQGLPPAIGVLVATDDAAQEIAKDVAQHIAAYAPKYFTREDVPQEIVDKEKKIIKESSNLDGKPEKVIEHILNGKLTGFYKEIVLLDQPLAKDPKITVEKFINQSGGNVKGYLRFRVGTE